VGCNGVKLKWVFLRQFYDDSKADMPLCCHWHWERGGNEDGSESESESEDGIGSD
jgi:hypothetical protein